MADKRISELDLLTTPSLTGVTAFSDAGTTYKVTLQGIKNTIIETGSIQTTGTTLYSANPLAGPPSSLNTTGSIFFGSGAGFSAPQSFYSIFLGENAGQFTSSSFESVFIGYEAGALSTGNTNGNICIGSWAGKNNRNGVNNVYIGQLAGESINGSYQFGDENIIMGTYAGNTANRTEYVVGMGTYALAYGDDNFFTIAIGHQSAQGLTTGSESTNVGYRTGYYAIDIEGSTNIGNLAGYSALKNKWGVSVGHQAGYYVQNSNYTVFLGYQAGKESYNSTSSIYVGYQAGKQSLYSENSNFIGYNSGFQSISSSFCTFIGYQAGYNQGGMFGYGLGKNNIIIGTNITLERDRQDSINIGGIIFGSGSNFNTGSSGFPVSGSAGGKIGINKVVPEHHFDVSGSIAGNSHFILSRVSSSLDFVDDAAASTGGVPLGGLYRSGSLIRIRLS